MKSHEVTALKIELIKKKLELKVMKQIPTIHEYRSLRRKIAKKLMEGQKNGK